MVCTTCQRTLSNEESMIAGMGAVCRERARFAEKIERNQLQEVEGRRELRKDGLYQARTAVVRIKGEESPRFVSILSVNSEQGESIFIDRTEMNKQYEEGKSLAESIADSLYGVQTFEVESVASAALPKNPNLRRRFKKFQKKDRQDLRERSEMIKNYGINNHYYKKVDSIKNLTEALQEARREFGILIDNDSEAKERFGKGKYHLATLMTRLNKYPSMKEAKNLLRGLKTGVNLDGVPLKDYGVTEKEILVNLSKAPREKALFQSFSRGNKHLDLMVEIYIKVGQEKDPMVKMKAHKALIALNNEKITQESKDKIKQIFPLLKISERDI